MISLVYLREDSFSGKKSPPSSWIYLRGLHFCRRFPRRVEGFRVRCPVPKDFRVDTEHLSRSTPSHFAPIGTLLPGVAQAFEWARTRCVQCFRSHLAQRERRVWVFLGRRTLPLIFGGSSAVGTGQASPRALLILLLPLLPELRCS